MQTHEQTAISTTLQPPKAKLFPSYQQSSFFDLIIQLFNVLKNTLLLYNGAKLQQKFTQ